MFLAFVSMALATPLAACPRTWPAASLGDFVESADLAMAKMDAAGFLGFFSQFLLNLQLMLLLLKLPADLKNTSMTNVQQNSNKCAYV